MTWQFVLTGFLIGTLVGLTGMGSGSLMTPILVIIFGFKPTVARRTSAKPLPAAGTTTPITLRPDA